MFVLLLLLTAPPQQTVTVRGALRSLDKESLTLEASDKRVITFRRSPKTMLLRDGRGIAASDFEAGDMVEVEGQQNEDGGFFALTVKWLSRPARSAGEAESQATAPRAPLPPWNDEDRPTLRRGMPAPRKRVSPPLTETPATGQAEMPAPPPPDPKMSLLEKAREVSETFAETLPNYFCQQMTTRFVRRFHSWEALDVLSAAVVYENGKESYRNVAVNGKPTNKQMENLSGAWSTGEFATVLRDLFAPSTAADFHYRKEDTVSHLAAFVYDFAVDQPHSHWQLLVPSQSFDPAYRGRVWIDKQSARVLRIEMEAVKLPEAFPLDQAESAVDYDFVTLGGTQKYLLPVHAEVLSCQRGTSVCSRNVMDFRNYRKFSADSKITFEK